MEAERWLELWRWIVGGGLLVVAVAVGRLFTPLYALDGPGKVRKAVSLVSAVAGLLLVMWALGWVGSAPHASGPSWSQELAKAELRAREEKKPLLVDFSADWCAACKKLERETFSQPKVADKLAGWITVRLDLTVAKPEQDEASQRYGMVGLPTVALVDAQGKLRTDLTLTGFEDADAFLARLEQVESGAAAKADGLAAKISAALASGSWWVYLLVFLAGLVASLSPCVYPLIPITLSVLAGGKASTPRQGFLRALAYVGGISMTYAVLGVIAASTGGLFGAALQSLWVVGLMVVIFSGMGLSMLGLFELRLPEALNQRLSQVGEGRGALLGPLLMGSVAGIVAAPCVGPPLVAVLTFVAAQGDLFVGLILMLTYSFGMGLLFLVLGTFSQLLNRLPRSGGWMDVVKGTLGLAMLVLAAAYLNDLVPFLSRG